MYTRHKTNVDVQKAQNIVLRIASATIEVFPLNEIVIQIYIDMMLLPLVA